MIARMFFAAAAVMALATGARAAPTTTAPAGGAGPNAKAQTQRAHKDLDDQEGNRLSFDVDDAGKASNVKAKRRDGTVLDVVELKPGDLTVCVPKAAGPSGAAAKKGATLCQTLEFVKEDAFFKMGSASCTCRMFGGTLYCYGTTCH